MEANVKCPVCGAPARWVGCAGCGDDYGSVVCKACGTMPGVCLSDLERVRVTAEPKKVHGWEQR